MWHNKKSYFHVQMMLVALGILLWNLAVPCTAQAHWWQSWWDTEMWWQEEIPPPGPNQVINPEYLKKKQELSNAWNQVQRQNNMMRQQSRWTTQASQNSYRSDGRAINKCYSLENQLRETPMYVEKGAPPAPGPELEGEVKIKY